MAVLSFRTILKHSGEWVVQPAILPTLHSFCENVVADTKNILWIGAVLDLLEQINARKGQRLLHEILAEFSHAMVMRDRPAVLNDAFPQRVLDGTENLFRKVDSPGVNYIHEVNANA